MKLRPSRVDCIACGRDPDGPSLIDQSDYLEVCGALPVDYEALGMNPGAEGYRIGVKVRDDWGGGGGA